MADAVALVDSPAQTLNAVEWAYATGTPTRIVQLAPTDLRTRLQMHRVAELARAHGFTVDWVEARLSPRHQAAAVARLAPVVRAADTVVLGDPYAGLAHLLLATTRNPRVVVVDDGTATIRYAEQWASGAPLVRWHEAAPPRLNRMVAGPAYRVLGGGSPAVSLFTAMPLTVDMPHETNAYAWARSLWGEPERLPASDLMGTSLVETGVVDENAYLAGVRRLVAGRAVGRYLPHRHESGAKLQAIEDMGVRIVRPDLPMELWARRGPIGGHVLSFPSTVLHTLPLVLGGVAVESLSVEDAWFTENTDEGSRSFVRGI
ncbi:hypothetical protein GCM10027418_12830 [Mariniluteicoccus endophyticus]